MAAGDRARQLFREFEASAEPPSTLKEMEAEGAKLVPSIKQAPPPSMVEKIESVTGPGTLTTIPEPIKAALAPAALVTAARFVPGAGPMVMGVQLSRLLAEMGLSALGEAVNQMTGITERSRSDVAISGVAPAAGRAIGGVIIRGTKGLVRAGFHRPFALAEVSKATEEALKYPTALKASLLSGPTSKELFAEVRSLGAANVEIPLMRTFGAAQELETRMAGTLKGIKTLGGSERARTLRAAQQLVEELQPQRGPTGQFISGTKKVDFEVLEGNLSELNSVIDSAHHQGNNRIVAAGKRLKAAIFEDIDNAADPLVGPLKVKYKEATKTFRMEKAIDTIDDLIVNNAKREQGFGSVKFLRGSQLADKFDALVRDDPLFTGSFSVTERNAIGKAFEKWARLPRTGMETGDVVIMGAAGGVIGRTIGGGAAEAAAAGAITSIAVSRVVAHAIANPVWRDRLLKIAIDNKGFLDRPAIAVLASGMFGAIQSARKAGVGGQTVEDIFRQSGGREIP